MSKNVGHAQEIITMATFGRPHGIKGYNNLNYHTQEIDSLFGFKNFFIQKNDNPWQQVEVEDLKLIGKKLIIKLHSASDPEQAKTYTHFKLGVLKSELPELSANEQYHFELMGLKVINSQGDFLGYITDIWSNGAHDVFEVKGDISRILPYINQVVLNIDLEQKTMLVEWQHDH